MREEIFGPIAPILVVDGEADDVARANAGDQGLAGYVYSATSTPPCAWARPWRSGMIAVNRGRVSSAAAPFCGVKQSGFGQAGGPAPSTTTLKRAS